MAPYLSVTSFWKYQNADVWKKAKIHPPWFKHYVHRDRELDALPYTTRLLFWELLAAATRYQNVLGPVENPDPNESWSESEAMLSWIWAETRIDPGAIAEGIPLLLKGGWLKQTKTPRRSRELSRKNLEDPRDQEVEVEVERTGVSSSTSREDRPLTVWQDVDGLHLDPGSLLPTKNPNPQISKKEGKP